MELLSILAGFVSGFLLNYFQEKGKNLATKEDIEDITRKVESVRGAINTRFQVSRFRYENEYKILTELTEKAVNLSKAIERLRPILNTGKPVGDDQKAKEKENKIKLYYEAMRALHEIADKKKPFFPAQIHEDLVQLRRLCFKEGFMYQHYDPNPNYDPDYWDDAQKNMKKIYDFMDKTLMKGIRRRIEQWEKMDLSQENL